MNGRPHRPLGIRKTVQLMVILTILAWATQTLFHQWGFGGLILPNSGGAATQPVINVSSPALPATQPAATSATPTSATPTSATLELRDQVVVQRAGEVTLKQVCRWDEKDSATLAPLADVIVGKVEATGTKISIEQVRTALRRAGANMTIVQLSGATTCAIDRGEIATDVMTESITTSITTSKVDEPVPPHLAAELAPREPADPAPAPQTPQNVAEIALKNVLVDHLSEQIGIEKDQLDIAFNSQDRATIELTFPRCTFNIDTSNARSLGPVTWQIVADTPQGQKKCDVRAVARTWQEHLVLNRPLSRGQTILDRDVAAKRELTDRLLEDAIVDRDQVVGQQAAKALAAGDVLTANSIQPTPMVQIGDMVMVKLHLSRGTTVSTVARAIDGGGKGQTIHAKNEANNDVYDVVVTGKLEAESKSVADIAAAKVASTGRENAIDR